MPFSKSKCRPWNSLIIHLKGGKGSGFHGHSGRIGLVGGSGEGNVSIPAGGNNLSWNSEDTIKGELVLEGITSNTDIKSAIRYALPGKLDHIHSASDIENINILDTESGDSWVRVKLDITPSKDAGASWLDEAGGEEEWGLYHGKQATLHVNSL
jgi:hypothetical protein